MLNADYLKEKIGWLKVVVGLSLALLAPLVSWLVQNYAIKSRLIVGIAVFFTGILLTIIIESVEQINRCIQHLEKL